VRTSEEPQGEFPDVLLGAQRGESWAFTTLFRQLGAPILGYLRAQRVEDPDDLANEVFLRAFRTIGTFEGDRDRFRSWIFAIAHNLSIDAHRRAQRRPVTTPQDVTLDITGGDVEDDVLVRLAQERVDELLAGCTPDQRNVLLLRIVADMSVADTAAALGKGYEAVKALQRRGLEAVERALEAEGVKK
jgi:RNA polymerase sigma factor (sigma-70 family)